MGFFVEVWCLEKKALTYDASSPDFNLERPLWEALVFLLRHGFYTRAQLEEALIYREAGGRKPRSKGALRALAAVAAMKLAADHMV